MRYSRIYDGDGGFMDEPVEGRGVDLSTPQEPAAPSAPTAPAPTAPSSEPKPGPNSNPAPQGGPASPPIPPPPAIASSVPGVVGSEATGGVQGSFGQAGSSEFSRRFGMPAAWFRGGPTAGLAREAGNTGRGVLGRERAGQTSGSFGAENVASVAAPSAGLEGGGKNDEEFQRVIQAVLRNKFSAR